MNIFHIVTSKMYTNLKLGFIGFGNITVMFQTVWTSFIVNIYRNPSSLWLLQCSVMVSLLLEWQGTRKRDTLDGNPVNFRAQTLMLRHIFLMGCFWTTGVKQNPFSKRVLKTQGNRWAPNWARGGKEPEAESLPYPECRHDMAKSMWAPVLFNKLLTQIYN